MSKNRDYERPDLIDQEVLPEARMQIESFASGFEIDWTALAQHDLRPTHLLHVATSADEQIPLPPRESGDRSGVIEVPDGAEEELAGAPGEIGIGIPLPGRELNIEA